MKKKTGGLAFVAVVVAFVSVLLGALCQRHLIGCSEQGKETCGAGYQTEPAPVVEVIEDARPGVQPKHPQSGTGTIEEPIDGYVGIYAPNGKPSRGTGSGACTKVLK